jgi:hypothetical protein
MEGRLGGVVVAIVIIGAVIGFKFYNKGSAADDVLLQARETVAQCPVYTKDPAYCDMICEACHDAAFDAAYTLGGRRSSAKFDESKYWDELYRGMMARANADGRKDVADALYEQYKASGRL